MANSVLSLFTVPVILAILAQSAVIYSWRRKDSTQLSFIQLLALANRGWADVATIYSARHKEPESGLVVPTLPHNLHFKVHSHAAKALLSSLYSSC